MQLKSEVVSSTKFMQFERLTAGFCMAIPFYLLVTDSAAEGKINYSWLLLPIGLMFFPPMLLQYFLKRFFSQRKYHGARMMVSAALLLFVLFFVFTRVLEIESKPSISAYVTMRDSFVFGMVLAIGAMLFLATGFVYFEQIEKTEAKGEWRIRKYINILLGGLLLCVIIFPCTTQKLIHSIVAFAFFILCAVGTIRRDVSKDKSAPKRKIERGEELYKIRLVQRFADYVPVLLMVYFGIAHFFPATWIFGWIVPGPITLFAAECIALWIVGVDFIVVSLKQE